MNYTKKELISSDKIQEAVKALGAEIASDYAGSDVVLVCILKGSVFFFSDLAHALESLDPELDFMKVSSYHGAKSQSMDIEIALDLHTEIEGKHVILVEDIIDSGNTLGKVIALLQKRNPKSIAVAALTYKQHADDLHVKTYKCFQVDQFVIGYGMDYMERFRTLPFIAELCEEKEPQ